MKDWSEYKPETFDYNGKWIRNWFSNMVECPIIINGIIWRSVENYYQAQKCISPHDKFLFSDITPQKAKQLGRRIQIRSDWGDIKYRVMKEALLAKFTQNKVWFKKLIETDDDIIIEWNNWNDRIWGVDIRDCKGQNLLGQALMETREHLNS